MGPQERYNRTEKLDLAVMLLMDRGYSATSVAALVECLGINCMSLYAEFGSKAQLFDTVLERYNAVRTS